MQRSAQKEIIAYEYEKEQRKKARGALHCAAEGRSRLLVGFFLFLFRNGVLTPLVCSTWTPRAVIRQHSSSVSL